MRPRNSRFSISCDTESRILQNTSTVRLFRFRTTKIDCDPDLWSTKQSLILRLPSRRNRGLGGVGSIVLAMKQNSFRWSNRIEK